ncbi:flexible cuticle protein 12-like [Condylostylus longicornis]|uniref:flexible cuticle protein 12-like n=1 Tax=Condylostylus longicornis TaxID=2530218 RepID=UPI00244DCE6B|nr:flexible cuticle protein 12-like [Condylostylus longicornis]
MKFVIILSVIFAVALAIPADVEIVRYDNDNIGTDGYKFYVETSDGKKHDESGQLKNIGTEQEGIAVQGSFSYIGDDGQPYTINYVADENGFQPQGAHIPVAP